MKSSLYIVVFVLGGSMLSGCQKEAEPAVNDDSQETVKEVAAVTATPPETKKLNQVKSRRDAKAEFQASDQKINEFLDKLDNPQTSQTERIRILCHDYPQVYKTQYMPALLMLTPQNNTEAKLLNELKTATDYYKQGFGIQCESGE